MKQHEPAPDRALSTGWRNALVVIAACLLPAFAVLFIGGIALLASDLRVYHTFGARDLPLGFVPETIMLVASAFPVLFWMLYRRKWYSSSKKYVLLSIGILPIALAISFAGCYGLLEWIASVT